MARRAIDNIRSDYVLTPVLNRICFLFRVLLLVLTLYTRDTARRVPRTVSAYTAIAWEDSISSRLDFHIRTLCRTMPTTQAGFRPARRRTQPGAKRPERCQGFSRILVLLYHIIPVAYYRFANKNPRRVRQGLKLTDVIAPMRIH